MPKKRKKRKRKLNQKIKHELLGLLFIFLAIFGSGASAISDGIIPGGLDHIFRFFFGIWYFAASIFLLVTGIVLLVKRRYPDFTYKKMVGFYIFFAGLLLLTHIQTLERLHLLEDDISILGASWNNFFAFIDGNGTSAQTGGGMAGALLLTFSYFLFSSAGTKIVSVFSMLVGIVFLTEFSIGDFFSKLFTRMKQTNKKLLEKVKHKKAAKKEQKQQEPEIQMHNEVPAETESAKAEPFIADFTDKAYADDTKPQGKTKKKRMKQRTSMTKYWIKICP
ncbi:hypothetical protein P5G51_010870 [Virgibacillus sp. 179-BFC.A HS]|uniref:DNA translocase FtsK 4TM region domain-containing protein n=1 Tax=Tigheibacillus jepli TaxID=3035914 RepID=A0ABU5CHK0_9BACI|nr:hypothetical protein [Virgibacillus sp. 179-BFC.A HS]MDY0405829.1 hypothetical protein [Virgibacillus sp. 179-BFC.A HS]